MIDDQSLILVDNCWLVGSTYSDSKPRQGREAILQFGSLWPPMFAFWCSTAIISNRCWHALECCGSWRNIAGRSMAGTFDKLSFVDCIFFTFAKCILRLQRQTGPDSILCLRYFDVFTEVLHWIPLVDLGSPTATSAARQILDAPWRFYRLHSLEMEAPGDMASTVPVPSMSQ